MIKNQNYIHKKTEGKLNAGKIVAIKPSISFLPDPHPETPQLS